MDKTFTGGSQTKFMKFFSVKSFLLYGTIPKACMSVSLSGVIVALIIIELNLVIALVIAESHYASGVIVALLLEGVIIIMELNMAWQ